MSESPEPVSVTVTDQRERRLQMELRSLINWLENKEIMLIILVGQCNLEGPVDVEGGGIQLRVREGDETTEPGRWHHEKALTSRCWLWRQRTGPWGQECGWLLGAGKSKKVDSPLQKGSSRRKAALLAPGFLAQGDPLWTSDLHNVR